MISSSGCFSGCPSETFCFTPELIENYDKAVADETQTWDCHHRLETHNSDGERRLVDLTKRELKALGMYYNRPPEELIFMTSSEHIKLHRVGKRHSEESKHKMSISHNCKAVICIETGVVYRSTKEAERQTGIGCSRICMVCKGDRKTAGGFHWRYE